MVKILIVDDEEEIVESIYSILKKAYPRQEFLKTTLGRQAREILRTDIVDILLTDIKMPNYDGFQLSETAKQSNPACHVIFLTGYSDFDYAYRALKTGCDDFILKNNAEQEIIKSLAGCIERIDREKHRQDMLFDSQTTQVTNSRYLDGVKFVQEYIAEHIDSDMSLNRLARMVYLNPTYLSRLFKSTTGCTITEYLLVVRIEKAKLLLMETEKKVQDISLAVGIDSPVYFSRIFKKSTGQTPQEFRAMYYGNR